MAYAISSNLISLTISTLFIFILPKVLGVEDYGYFQLYMFYCVYVGVFHFGWNDGIYLRYGGIEYNEIDKELFFSQFVMLLSSQIFFGILIWFFTLSITEINKVFIIKMVAISMIFINIRLMLVYILQITNRIKEYAVIVILDRIIFVALVVFFIFYDVKNYKVIIFADLLGKFVSLIYSMYLCKEIVFNKIDSLHLTINETIINISVGIKLMLANFSSLLIIGIIRLGIEFSWDIATFGKISLTLSISNLMMVLINSIGIIMFPVLRRTDVDSLPIIYITMRNFLTIPLLGVLLVYYPLNIVLSAWLPEYTKGLKYMVLLFPMCVYEGKMALLINTYLKTLRKERMILVINIISMSLSLFLTILFTLIFKNLLMAVLSILIVLAFRCILAEVLLSKILNVDVHRDSILEMALIIIFISTGWFFTLWLGVVTYLSAYILYLLIKKTEILETLSHVRQLVWLNKQSTL